MYYLIEETLKEIGFEEVKKASAQYVAVLTFDEWEENKDSFDMGIDIEPDFKDIHTTEAEVNFDSLTGSFFIPNRSDISDKSDKFSFALDEKGIVFMDNSGAAERIISQVRRTKKWRRIEPPRPVKGNFPVT